MRQQDKLRKPFERRPLGKLGLNGVYGAIAGTDGERIDAAAGHMRKQGRKLGKTFEHRQLNGILAQGAPQPFALASFPSRTRIDDQSNRHLTVRGSLIHELNFPMRALAENAWANWTACKMRQIPVQAATARRPKSGLFTSKERVRRTRLGLRRAVISRKCVSIGLQM